MYIEFKEISHFLNKGNFMCKKKKKTIVNLLLDI